MILQLIPSLEVHEALLEDCASVRQLDCAGAFIISVETNVTRDGRHPAELDQEVPASNRNDIDYRHLRAPPLEVGPPLRPS